MSPIYPPALEGELLSHGLKSFPNKPMGAFLEEKNQLLDLVSLAVMGDQPSFV